MDLLQIIILSLVQGLTEFLPISSSGHLVVFQFLMGLKEPPVVLDVMLHVGTLIAVLFYFRQELKSLFTGFIKRDKESVHVILLIFLGTLPAVLTGLLFEDQINQTFGSIKINGWLFLLTALLLFSTYWVRKNNKKFSELNWKDALIVGFFQAVSILPAVSRSGATIVSGLWLGASRETAFRFSFYLFVPAILGALTLQIPELLKANPNDLGRYFLGMVLAGISGYFSLILLESVLKSAKLYLFGFYCFILGIVVLLFI